MFIVLLLMVIGMFLGFLLQNKIKIIHSVDACANISIYILLFLLGVSIGINKTLLNNLETFGMQAFLLTIGGVIGSVFVTYFVQRAFFKNK